MPWLPHLLAWATFIPPLCWLAVYFVLAKSLPHAHEFMLGALSGLFVGMASGLLIRRGPQWKGSFLALTPMAAAVMAVWAESAYAVMAYRLPFPGLAVTLESMALYLPVVIHAAGIAWLTQHHLRRSPLD